MDSNFKGPFYTLGHVRYRLKRDTGVLERGLGSVGGFRLRERHWDHLGFFVLAIDGCNSLIRERATEECCNDSKSKGKADTSELIECLEDLGLDESQISASLREKGFNLRNN